MVGRFNSLWKARRQERQAARTLLLCRREFQIRRLSCPTGPVLEATLKRRLADRATGCWPKQKGDLHAFLAYYVSNWESILPRSLEPFGRVSSFNWREHGFDDSAHDWIKDRGAMNTAMLAAFHAANRCQPVDVVVGYLSGYNTDPTTLQGMAAAGAAIVNFSWDDKIGFPGTMVKGRLTSTAAIASSVDLNLTSDPNSVIKYAVYGGLAMFWPLAAHPEINHPYPVPFEWDVSFVGARYGWRRVFIERLHGLGINVECFGPGWPRGALRFEDTVPVFSRSRINLGVASVGHSRRLMCLKGRDFEVPMSGGLYLTQNNPELSLVYDVGREIVTYKDESDCASKIARLLADPELAEEIRHAGRTRALKDHSYEVRWGQVFRLSGLMS